MKKLPRWIFSSIVKHFETIANDNDIPYFVEGVDERDSIMQQDHVEIRVTGPNIKEYPGNYYHVEVVVNFLFTSYMDMSGNAYTLFDWCGILADEMNAPIPIYKYGDGGALIDCLRVKKNKADSVKIYHFGQMSTTDRFRQSEIDALYEMYVENL